jgi:hypothetical protein
MPVRVGISKVIDTIDEDIRSNNKDKEIDPKTR